MNLRGTDQVTVKEVFDNFAPEDNTGTACDLISFGRQSYFLVIQGAQAPQLTSLMMEFLDAVQKKAHDSSD